MEMDIVNLLSRMKRGEESAFRDMVFTYSKRLMTVSRIYAKSEEDAKDILQDAFLTVYQKIEKFDADNEAAFYTWLKRIVINKALNKNQRKHVTHEHSLDQMDFDKGINEQAISKMSHEEIMQLIFNLPDEQRKVFGLYVIEGYSHKEIGEMLNITETNSRTHLHRSRQILQYKIKISNKILTA